MFYILCKSAWERSGKFLTLSNMTLNSEYFLSFFAIFSLRSYRFFFSSLFLFWFWSLILSIIYIFLAWISSSLYFCWSSSLYWDLFSSVSSCKLIYSLSNWVISYFILFDLSLRLWNSYYIPLDLSCYIGTSAWNLSTIYLCCCIVIQKLQTFCYLHLLHTDLPHYVHSLRVSNNPLVLT